MITQDSELHWLSAIYWLAIGLVNGIACTRIWLLEDVRQMQKEAQLRYDDALADAKLSQALLTAAQRIHEAAQKEASARVDSNHD